MIEGPTSQNQIFNVQQAKHVKMTWNLEKQDFVFLFF